MHLGKENMHTKMGLMLVVALVVGIATGHLFLPKSPYPMPMSHMMPDGSMMGNTMESMTAGLQGKIGDEFDNAFTQEMIVHHQGAVAMAQLALTNANHPEVKQLAQNIITAQNSEITMMQGWLKTWSGQ